MKIIINGIRKILTLYLCKNIFKMPNIYFLKTNKYTIALLNPTTNNFLLFSAFTGKDNSSYITINSGLINYAKFSYHPRKRSIQFAFTDELWDKLAKAGKGRPNKERIKSYKLDLSENQHMVTIFIHGSSLFRPEPCPKDNISINFQLDKIFRIDFYLENNIPMVNHRFIDKWEDLERVVETERKKIHELNAKLKSSEPTGIAHLMNDYDFPWKMLCIGI